MAALWFAGGQVALAIILLHHGDSAKSAGLRAAGFILMAGAYGVAAIHFTRAPGEPRPLTTVFGRAPANDAAGLRSRYEHQIRAAAMQEERNRLARDLHDSVKQQIFVVQTAAATAQARFESDPAGARQAVDQIRTAAREAMTEMQVMLDQLRSAPLENKTLAESIRSQCEALGFRAGARVDCQVGELPPSESLVPGAHEAIQRVAQEALANIGRHARASNVWVRLESGSGQVRLEVRDDGAGFDAGTAPRGDGLANMRTRAGEFGGEFECASAPGRGTVIRLSIPYAEPRDPYARVYSVVAYVILLVLLGLRRADAGWLLLIVSIVAVAWIAAAWLHARKAEK